MAIDATIEAKQNYLNEYSRRYIEFNVEQRQAYKKQMKALTFKGAMRKTKPFTDLEFWNQEVKQGSTQETKAYVEKMNSLGQLMIDKLNPTSVFEIGCGPGALLEFFSNQKKVTQLLGVDKNKHARNYFLSRNKKMHRNYFLAGIDKIKFEQINPYDLLIAIEVFEHIPDKILHPIINKLANKFKYFWFSSTPHQSNEYGFDKRWGHINIKPVDEWISIFEKAGFKLIDRPNNPTNWTLVFESKILSEKK